jgi:regulator of sirC expression with transglutaminase-like and TPR domain
MTDDPLEYLKQVGLSGEGPHDIARAALMLAALDHPSRPLDPYLAHVHEIEQAMRAESGLILRVEDGARALVQLVSGRLGYDGDRMEYDDPRNADLIAVIDRRRGLPVALGILYMHAARAAGMSASGLNTQSHFVLRLAHRGDELTIDPFHGGQAVDREHLPVELRPDDAGLAQPVSDTDVLLRLQNNLKMRALGAGDAPRALELTRRMVLVAPGKPDLWFDLARLNEAVGILGAARNAYEMCLERAPSGQVLHNEAAIALSQLKRRLN